MRNVAVKSPTDFLGTTITVQIDRPLGSLHPEHGFEYPLNYGFIPGHFSADGEGLDAYVLGCPFPVRSFTGCCIAVIQRLNDQEDKLVVVPAGHSISDEEIRLATHFQEQFFISVLQRSAAA